MARSPRITYFGAWYHVMNRGAGRRPTYSQSEACSDYEEFLGLMKQISRRYQVEIHAYCLMGNHYHILIRTPLGNISTAMKHLDGVYTKRYNQHAKTDGPLFRGRFKSILVEADTYVLRLTRYIHLNPVVAGYVKRPEDYRWSSYLAYLNPRKRPDWLYCKETLAQFGPQGRKKKYRLFVEEGIDTETDDFFKRLRRIPILGSDAFKTTITDRYLENATGRRQLLLKQGRETNRSAASIMRIVAKEYRVTVSSLKDTNPGLKNQPRAVAMYLAHELLDMRYREISMHFKEVSAEGVRKACQRIEASLRLGDDHTLYIRVCSLIKQVLQHP